MPWQRPGKAMVRGQESVSSRLDQAIIPFDKFLRMIRVKEDAFGNAPWCALHTELLNILADEAGWFFGKVVCNELLDKFFPVRPRAQEKSFGQLVLVRKSERSAVANQSGYLMSYRVKVINRSDEVVPVLFLDRHDALTRQPCRSCGYIRLGTGREAAILLPRIRLE